MSEVSQRYIQAGAALRRELIERHPSRRQEEVAIHYVSLANHARDLYELIDQRKVNGPMTELDDMIAHLEVKIAEAHYESFGTWPTWWVVKEGE